MLCVLCLIVLWGFSLVTSYSGVIDIYALHTVKTVHKVAAETLLAAEAFSHNHCAQGPVSVFQNIML